MTVPTPRPQEKADARMTPRVNGRGDLVVSLVPPMAREPRTIDLGTETRGKRVVLSRSSGFVYDHRAVSDPYAGADGRVYVQVVTELAWYRWVLQGTAPVPAAWPTAQVWLEDRDA